VDESRDGILDMCSGSNNGRHVAQIVYGTTYQRQKNAIAQKVISRMWHAFQAVSWQLDD